MPYWESMVRKFILIAIKEPIVFSLNIGTVLLTYNPSMVSFSSIPYVYTQIDEEDVESSMDIVNCKRQELEFKAGLEHGIAYTQKTKQPPLFLFDGSLIFSAFRIKR